MKRRPQTSASKMSSEFGFSQEPFPLVGEQAVEILPIEVEVVDDTKVDLFGL
jgi:hypothetical protein